MSDNTSKKILAAGYADKLREVVDYIVNHDEQAKALELLRSLEKAITENLSELKIQSRLLAIYQGQIIRLQFIALPALDDKEVIALLKNNFLSQYDLSDYDLLKKLNAKLVNIISIEDRNNFKGELLKSILVSAERITTKHELRTIQDWLKNYVSKVGLDSTDNLSRAQYLVSLKSDKNVSQGEYERLVSLFKFYDRLNLGSDEPIGFDEEPPIEIKGQLYIFRKGVLEPVTENKAVDEAMALAGGGASTDVLSSPVPAAPSAAQPRPVFADLEDALKGYAEGSLEHKAIKQEISRLKLAELKQAQRAAAQSDAQK